MTGRVGRIRLRGTGGQNAWWRGGCGGRVGGWVPAGAGMTGGAGRIRLRGAGGQNACW